MGAGAHQQVARAAVAATDHSPAAIPRLLAGGGLLGRVHPGQPTDRRDRQDPLGSAAAVTPQQHPAVGVQGIPEAAVNPFHPRPCCGRRGHQAHRESHHLGAAHRGQIGEVGRCGPPAHIRRSRGGLAEVQALHQHVGVHDETPVVPPVVPIWQEGCIIGELVGWGEGPQPPDQFPFAQMGEGFGARLGRRARGMLLRIGQSPQACSCRFSAPSSSLALTMPSSAVSSFSTSRPSTT